MFRAFTQPLILARLLDAIADGDSDGTVYPLAAYLVLVTFLRMMFMHAMANTNWVMGTLMRASAIGLLYRKVLTLRAESVAKMSTGKIITLMSADVERLFQAWFSHAYYMAPIAVALVVTIGWIQIGASILAGVGVTVAMLPIQVKVGRLFGAARKSTMLRTDRRVNTMKDILHGMRTVKMNAWEQPLCATVTQLRDAEVTSLARAAQMQGFTMSYFLGSVVFPSYASIVVYAATGGTLTSGKVFAIITLFTATRMTLGGFLPMAIQNTHELFVALGRMEELLRIDDDDVMVPPPSATEARVCVSHVSFAWQKVHGDDADAGNAKGVSTARRGLRRSTELLARTVLQDVSVDVAAGETVVVLGPVGSGKSTLLLLLLREVDPVAGTIDTGGVCDACALRCSSHYANSDGTWATLVSGNRGL